jgi:hypothetical protein
MGKKLGKFYIDSNLLKESEMLHKAFGKLEFIPYQAGYRYDIMALEAIGLSPMFDEIEEGAEPPLYQMALGEGDLGETYVTMIKVEGFKRLVG